MLGTNPSVVFVAEMYMKSTLGSSPPAVANIPVSWWAANSLHARSRVVAPRASREKCTVKSVLSIDCWRKFSAVVGSSGWSLLTPRRLSSDTVVSHSPSALATPAAFS